MLNMRQLDLKISAYYLFWHINQTVNKHTMNGCVSISEIVYLLCDEDMLYIVWADQSTKCANIPAIAHFLLLL